MNKTHRKKTESLKSETNQLFVLRVLMMNGFSDEPGGTVNVFMLAAPLPSTSPSPQTDGALAEHGFSDGS